MAYTFPPNKHETTTTLAILELAALAELKNYSIRIPHANYRDKRYTLYLQAVDRSGLVVAQEAWLTSDQLARQRFNPRPHCDSAQHRATLQLIERLKCMLRPEELAKYEAEKAKIQEQAAKPPRVPLAHKIEPLLKRHGFEGMVSDPDENGHVSVAIYDKGMYCIAKDGWQVAPTKRETGRNARAAIERLLVQVQAFLAT